MSDTSTPSEDDFAGNDAVGTSSFFTAVANHPLISAGIAVVLGVTLSVWVAAFNPADIRWLICAAVTPAVLISLFSTIVAPLFGLKSAPGTGDRLDRLYRHFRVASWIAGILSAVVMIVHLHAIDALLS